jgi:hypothetical protein
VGRTDLISQRSNRQYPRRCRVSRPGSGWNGVGPRRWSHATGAGCCITITHFRGIRRSRLVRSPSGSRPLLAAHCSATRQRSRPGSPRPCALVASTPRRASSSSRLPSYLLGDLPGLTSEDAHLEAQFPLRCFQRFLLPDIATEPAGRPTTPPPAVRPRRSSRTKRSPSQRPKRP